jgi:hypothetical protein
MDSLDMVCHFWGTKLKHSDSWSYRFMMLRRKIQDQCNQLKITWTLPSWFYTFVRRGPHQKIYQSTSFPSLRHHFYRISSIFPVFSPLNYLFSTIFSSSFGETNHLLTRSKAESLVGRMASVPSKW